MAKTIYKSLKAADFRIKYKDYFHMKHFYMMLYEWLVEESYVFGDIYYDRAHEDFPEVFYYTRETQHAGKEIWIWWRFTKTPGGNAFWRYDMQINMHVILLKDTEIVYKGQKFPTNWGDCEVFIKADIVTDYDGTWENHWLLKHFVDLYRGRVIKTVLERHKIYLHREAYRLQEAIKSYWNLKCRLPEREDQAGLIFPRQGIGEPQP